jgi:taurine dioxygenase
LSQHPHLARQDDLPVISPVSGTLGAEVTGLDLRGDYGPEVRRVLVEALHEHGVLFVRFEGEIGPEEHRRLSSVFGELHQSHLKGEIPFVSILDSDKVADYGADRWHSDATMLPRSPRIASLRAIMLPEAGGDTMWASMYAAYEALSPKMQRFLEGLEALHASDTLLNARPALRENNIYAENLTKAHPVVIRDQVTGRPALYVNSNWTQSILGLSDQESHALLRMLLDHVNTPDFHVRLKWDIRTIAIWEQRITQHRGISDFRGRRVLHRTQIMGDAPQAYGNTIP